MIRVEIVDLFMHIGCLSISQPEQKQLIVVTVIAVVGMIHIEIGQLIS